MLHQPCINSDHFSVFLSITDTDSLGFQTEFFFPSQLWDVQDWSCTFYMRRMCSVLQPSLRVGMIVIMYITSHVDVQDGIERSHARATSSVDCWCWHECVLMTELATWKGWLPKLLITCICMRILWPQSIFLVIIASTRCENGLKVLIWCVEALWVYVLNVSDTRG